MRFRFTILMGIGALLAVLLNPTAFAAEAGDITMPFSLGTNVYTHKYATANKPAKDTTIADSYQLSEFPGIGYFVTDQLRLGVNLQFTEVVTEPKTRLPSRYATFAVLPQVNYNFWGPLTMSIVPSFAPRFGGEEQYAFYIQGVMSAAFPLADRLNGTVAIEVPYFFKPYRAIGITPLVGVSYLVKRASDDTSGSQQR